MVRCRLVKHWLMVVWPVMIRRRFMIDWFMIWWWWGMIRSWFMVIGIMWMVNGSMVQRYMGTYKSVWSSAMEVWSMYLPKKS